MHEKLFKMYDTRRDVWKETDEKLCDVVYRKITVVAKTFSGRNIEHSAINFSNYVPYFENGKISAEEMVNFFSSRVLSI